MREFEVEERDIVCVFLFLCLFCFFKVTLWGERVAWTEEGGRVWGGFYKERKKGLNWGLLLMLFSCVNLVLELGRVEDVVVVGEGCFCKYVIFLRVFREYGVVWKVSTKSQNWFINFFK
jgi:hypothetical protein